MRVKPERHYVIERILNLSDLNSKYSLVILEELERQIEHDPLIVLSWISGFKLFDFYQRNFKKIIISCLIQKIDVSQFLLKEDNRKTTVALLDSFLSRPRPQPQDDLERRFLESFETKKIEEQCFKNAVNHFQLESTIPNTVVSRILGDFVYQTERFPSNTEQATIIVVSFYLYHTIMTFLNIFLNFQQTLRSAYDHPNIFKKIFPTIRRRDPQVSDAFVYEMNDSDVISIQPWNTRTAREKESLMESRNFVKNILYAQNPYTMPVNSGDFQIHWIGSQDQWPQLLQWLQPRPVIGFDVEANFVCQNSNGVQQ